MSIRLFAFFALFVFLAASLNAQPATQPASQPARGPAAAKSVEEITKAAEPQKGFGYINTAEFNSFGRKLFALWYCPFSGRGDCFLLVYYFDFEKTQWTRLVDKLVPASGDLSAELSGETLIFRSADKEALRVPVSEKAFPPKK